MTHLWNCCNNYSWQKGKTLASSDKTHTINFITMAYLILTLWSLEYLSFSSSYSSPIHHSPFPSLYPCSILLLLLLLPLPPPPCTTATAADALAAASTAATTTTITSTTTITTSSITTITTTTTTAKTTSSHTPHLLIPLLLPSRCLIPLILLGLSAAIWEERSRKNICKCFLQGCVRCFCMKTIPWLVSASNSPISCDYMLHSSLFRLHIFEKNSNSVFLRSLSTYHATVSTSAKPSGMAHRTKVSAVFLSKASLTTTLLTPRL